ncbi:vacuolar protein sorting-associated protein 8-like, partial [Trifolium medium]|nr:vacuolar protein sorting-associated protein 8-like [Trifolium medium]
FPQPVPVSISRVKPDKPPRPFSSSFGRVTPNAKPGAALAAAAASRSVPTPHAAVIISRRRSYNLARTESDCSDVDSKGRELGEKIDDSVERKIERSVSVDDVEIGEIEVNGDDVHVVSEEKPSPEV